MLARAAPTTVPATLRRDPSAAAVMAARAPPTTWVKDRAGLGFSAAPPPSWGDGCVVRSRRSVLIVSVGFRAGVVDMCRRRHRVLVHLRQRPPSADGCQG